MGRFQYPLLDRSVIRVGMCPPMESHWQFQYPLLDRSVIRGTRSKCAPGKALVSVSTTGSFGNPAARAHAGGLFFLVSVSTTGSFGNPGQNVNKPAGKNPGVSVSTTGSFGNPADGRYKFSDYDDCFSIHYWIVR